MTGPTDEWRPVLPVTGLPERRSVRIQFEETDVMLYRAGDHVFALGNLCTHQGGPLHRGRVQGMDDRLTVTCPIHGSIFRLSDGGVLRGPAIRPVAAYEARISDGEVELRKPSDDQSPEESPG